MMKNFESFNRLAWIILVISFLVKKEETKKIWQIGVLITLAISLILECFGV